jgi:hypothetical protein
LDGFQPSQVQAMRQRVEAIVGFELVARDDASVSSQDYER